MIVLSVFLFELLLSLGLSLLRLRLLLAVAIFYKFWLIGKNFATF